MSLNSKPEPQLSFEEREREQLMLMEPSSIRADKIKTDSRGLRAFLFYRNYFCVKAKKVPKSNRPIILKRKSRNVV